MTYDADNKVKRPIKGIGSGNALCVFSIQASKIPLYVDFKGAARCWRQRKAKREIKA